MRSLKGRTEFEMKRILAMLVTVAVALGAVGCSSAKGGKGQMRDITSMELVSEMGVGWNLGNTLDVCSADRNGDGRLDEAPEEGEKVDETLWGNVMTTPQLFEELKADGINAVRIPVTWRDHIGKAPDYKIDKEWLERVHQVVKYAMQQDMYVIINLHHDGGGDPKYGAWIRKASRDYEEFEEKYTALWTQIAESFKNYSDKLIFESMNEVGFDDMRRKDGYELLTKINQLFVDIIRESGGNNSERHLLIAGYWTDTEMTCSPMYKLPEDPADRMIVSVHYYTPWQFCTTNQRKIWGGAGDVRVMTADVNKLKETFVDNGIPVIIGEYGTGAGNDPASRVYFCEMLTKLCADSDIPCFFWDNGEEFDRESFEWRTQGLIEALNRAVSDEDYVPVKQS
ncbi:MAG: glycoside hydrolase family 5 protein [Ruminococcus sp.]|nr:glycoside hydrolase family 5 protein [Ruminococcus sp.]